jgi:magnesium-transporting ATPase (P-type)
MGRRTTSLEGFWDRPLQELFQQLQATPAGLTTEEASRRLRLYGPDSLVRESRFAALFSFFGFFANPPVIILVVASGVSLALGEHVGGLIIIAIVLFSVLLNFLMEFQARHAVAALSDVVFIAQYLRRTKYNQLVLLDLATGPKDGELTHASTPYTTMADDPAHRAGHPRSPTLLNSIQAAATFCRTARIGSGA